MMAVKAAAVSSTGENSDSQASRYSPVHHSLGKGGMGSVELATRREGRFLRVYAVKRLSEALRDTESGRTMFMDEARIAGLLRHPNVVSVLDVGEDERGPYLVMDYVKGLDLAAILRGLRARGRKMPVDVAIRILADAAAGLHAAHELRGTKGEPLSLVHRDVSPHNVLIDFEGTVRLSDFGIAKAIGQIGRTSTGTLKGKLEYMAPEQLRFEPVDRRSDLFALGAIGFEMLTCKRLFAGESANEVARAVLGAEIPDIVAFRDDCPPALHGLLLEMLARDPERRPRSAADVKRRLEGILREWSRENGEPRELSEFLAESFEEHRAQVETVYASVLADAERAASSPGLRPTEGPSSTARPEPTRRRRWPYAIAAGALVIITAAIVAGALLGTGADPRLGASEPPSAASPPPIGAPGASGPAAQPAEPEPTIAGAVDEAGEAVIEPVAEEEVEPVATPRATRAHPRRHGHRARPEMAPAMPSGGGGVDGIWLPGQSSR